MSKTNFVATSLAPRAATLSSRLVAPRPSSLGVWRTGTLRSVQTNTAWSRGALCAGRLARTPRRNFSAQQSPNPAAEPPPSAEEPLVHNVETLSESYYAFQESVLNFQVMGASVPRFWVGLVVFGLTGLVKDFVTLSAGDVLQRPELTEDQKLAIWATAGDKEDFVLNQLPVAVSMSDPWTLLTIPLLSSLFAASVGIWWGRMRVRKLFDKFIFLETQKGHISAPEVVEGARKGIISRGATITAIGTMALTTTYISFYALVTRFWFRDYVDQMNEWRWKVPEGKEGELLAKLPSDVQLHGYSLATFLYFVFIQLLVLKITPFVIVPSFAAFFPMMTVLSQSPVILRVMDKQRAKVETLEAAGALPVSPRLLAGESGDDSLSSEFLAEEGSDEADDGSGGASPSLSGNVFDKSAAHGPGRVRALVSRKKHDQQQKDQDRAIAEVLGDDEGHGKENQWGDVVLEDEANQQA